MEPRRDTIIRAVYDVCAEMNGATTKQITRLAPRCYTGEKKRLSKEDIHKAIYNARRNGWLKKEGERVCIAIPPARAKSMHKTQVAVVEALEPAKGYTESTLAMVAVAALAGVIVGSLL